MVKSTLLLPATRHMASVREQEQAYDQLEDKMRRECEKREKQLMGQCNPEKSYLVTVEQYCSMVNPAFW